MTNDKIVISNIGNGWIRDFAKGSASSPASKPNTYFSGIFNIFRPNFLGKISSAFGENPTKMGSVSLPINATMGSNNHVYSILSNGLIKDFDASVSWNNSSTDYTQPTGCLDNKYKDIWKHVTPAGVESVFFTYETPTNAYMGYASVGSISTRNDTYFTFANKGVPHVGCKSVGNQSYITDGQYLQRYDPNSATPTGLRINCGTGWTLVSVADYGNYVVAIGNDGVSCRMFMCTGTDVLPSFQYEIRDTTATTVVNEGGLIRVFCYGKNGTTKIKTFNGSGFSEEGDWEVPISLCASPEHNMVDVWMNQIIWKTPDGYLWTYGSPIKDELNTGAHRIAALSTGGSTSLGLVKNLYRNNLYIGMNYLSNFYMFQVKADESYSSSLTSTIRTALYDLPNGSAINGVEFIFADYTPPGPTSNGSSLRCRLYKAYETDPLIDHSIPASLSSTPEKIYRYPVSGSSIGNIDSFYMNVDFTNCIIKRIEIFYTYDAGDL